MQLQIIVHPNKYIDFKANKKQTWKTVLGGPADGVHTKNK